VLLRTCHGVAADGNGPSRVGRGSRFIDGRTVVTFHRPREMPVSGERFAAPEAKPTAGRRERCEGRHGGGAEGDESLTATGFVLDSPRPRC